MNRGNAIHRSVLSVAAALFAAVICWTEPASAGTMHRAGSWHQARATHLRKPAKIKRHIKAPRAAQLPYTVVPKPRTPKWWKTRHAGLVKRAAAGGVDLMFLGDSITEGMNRQLLDTIFGTTAVNFGISGDGTQHLLWRMQHGELGFKGPAPKLAVFLIGTNNLQSNTRLSAAERHEVFLGIQANVHALRSKLPSTKVLVLGILPREELLQHPIRAEIDALNKEVATLADNQSIWYADIGADLLESDGSLSLDVMADFLHPTDVIGYERMFNAIKTHVNSIPH